MTDFEMLLICYLDFFVQDQRGRKDFRKAQFISLSNQIYIPLWVVLVCSNMASVPKLDSKYTLGKNTSNSFLFQFFYDLLFDASDSPLWSGLTYYNYRKHEYRNLPY